MRCVTAVSASERRRQELNSSHMNDNTEHKTRKNDMGKTINKHIRVDEEYWKQIEKAAQERGISPSRLMISAALETIKGREWPRTEAEIHLLRSAMFVAQAIIRDMEKDGRDEEIEQISKSISQVAPELPGNSATEPLDQVDTRTNNS